MKEYGFGVDLGGTTVKLGFFRMDGTLLDKWEIPTDKTDNGKNVLSDIAKAVSDKIKEKDIAPESVEGIGIGVPGAVNNEGVVNRCVNIGWGVVEVAKELHRLTNLRVEVDNDANIAALGESWMGSGKNFDSMVMVTLGTGVGGGVICNGRIVRGHSGAAGEIGHIIVSYDETEECSCGHCGCLEQYASATGVVRLAKRELAKTKKETTLRTMETLTSKDIFDAAKKQDEVATEVVKKMGTILGRALAKISVITNPQGFVIGGGVSKAGNIVIEAIETSFRKDLYHACSDTQICLASLGNDAGIYGGARMLICH